MLVLLLVFWKIRMLKLVNDKKRVSGGWNALNDSEYSDQ